MATEIYRNRLLDFRIAELMSFDALVNGVDTEADRRQLVDMARIAEYMGADVGLCFLVQAALQVDNPSKDCIELVRELLCIHDQQRDDATPKQYITAIESITCISE